MLHAPQVVQFAQSVASGEPIEYAGDPLRDFGLMPFLDKFVFKNPKAAKRNQKGGSIMQPAMEGVGSFGGTMEAQAMNSRGAVATMLSKPISKIASHERFFHTYFSQKRSAEEKLQAGKKIRPASIPTPTDADADKGDGEDAEEEAFATRLAQSLLDDDFYEDDDYSGEDEGEGEGDDDEDEDNENEEDGEYDEESDGDLQEDAADAVGGDIVAQPKRKGRKRGGGPTFVDADEFAAMLEAAGDENEGLHPKLAEWEGGKRAKRSSGRNQRGKQ